MSMAGDERWVLPDQAAALKWVTKRNEQGIRCMLDVLASYARSPAQVDLALANYTGLASAIRAANLDASLSVKLTTLGATFDRELCQKNLIDLAARVHNLGVGFELDMENRMLVDMTLEAAESCARGGIPVTLALQAYLHRTPKDLDRMLESGVKVRLVKGAYSGDISDFEIIQEVYKDLAEELIERGVPWAAATHDPALIAWFTEKISNKERAELGFLKGLADETKVSLASQGYRIAEYVPFGEVSEGYIARRSTYLKRLSELGRIPAP